MSNRVCSVLAMFVGGLLLIVAIWCETITSCSGLQFGRRASVANTVRPFAAPPSHFRMLSNKVVPEHAPPIKTTDIRRFIPNALTVARIVSVPAFATTFMTGKQGTSMVLYASSCLTDLLDGMIARKLNATSDFGAFLDPVADKIMVSTALTLLLTRFPSTLMVIPVALILSREIAVSSLREFMATKQMRNIVQVGFLGKVKTAVQMIATAVLLAVVPEQVGLYDVFKQFGWSKVAAFTAGVGMLYVSAVLAWLSGWQYLRAAWPALSGNLPSIGSQTELLQQEA